MLHDSAKAGVGCCLSSKSKSVWNISSRTKLSVDCVRKKGLSETMSLAMQKIKRPPYFGLSAAPPNVDKVIRHASAKIRDRKVFISPPTKNSKWRGQYPSSH